LYRMEHTLQNYWDLFERGLVVNSFLIKDDESYLKASLETGIPLEDLKRLTNHIDVTKLQVNFNQGIIRAKFVEYYGGAKAILHTSKRRIFWYSGFPKDYNKKDSTLKRLVGWLHRWL